MQMDHLISSVFEDFCGNVTGSQCAKNGGLASLLNAFALHSEQTKFRAGSFGSVWFDMKLEGGSGSAYRKKLANYEKFGKRIIRIKSW